MIFEKLLDAVMPKTCVGCEKLGTFLCGECRDRLDFADQICSECGEFSSLGWTHEGCRRSLGMEGLICIFEYGEEVMKKAVEAIKYGFNQELMGMLLENFVFDYGEDFDWVVPMPLFFYRKNWRGFNQAELLAEIVASRSGVAMVKAVVRTRNTQQQAKLENEEERVKNVAGAFKIKEDLGEKVKGKKIILVDDVFTSGASMREVCKVLKESGALKVWGVVLAH